MIKLRPDTKELLLGIVDGAGAFSAWEVMILAIFLISAEMPEITGNIINKNSQVCQVLSKNGYGDECLSVEFIMRPLFAAFIANMLLMNFLSYLVTKTTE